jgi:ferredoxin
MQDLRNKAKELLAAGTVKVIIGCTEGTKGAVRPMFARTPEDADKLIFDQRCTQNLATYLTKAEVKKLGRLALVGGTRAMRSILQLAAEKQFAPDAVTAIYINNGKVTDFANVNALEEALAMVPDSLSDADKATLDKLSAMSTEERRAFWNAELSRCMKCYACRQSCPMCYCDRCTMEVNRPQWVPVASHGMGNFEYHVVRAMHLAGRCVQCGTCGAACPVGIPVHLLTFFAEDSVRRQFGQRGGASAKIDFAMTTFRPDDKESFIR